MSSAARRIQYTLDEYFELERHSEFKHEYHEGQIFAMAGASLAHNVISGNLVGEFHATLRGGRCRVLPGDMRVCVSETGLYTYPDVAIVCGEIEVLPGSPEALLNPTVLCEVLSPTTQDYDRGGKWGHYQRLPSLQAFVLVNQNCVEIEVRQRSEGGWSKTRYLSLDDMVEISCLGCRILAQDIYANVPGIPSPVRHVAPPTS